MARKMNDWKPPEIEEGKPTRWNWVVQGKDSLELGSYTDIGAFTYINAKFGVEVQEQVQIGSHCAIYSASTIDNKQGKVTLERNCRVGSHCVIMPGVTIGKNSIIGACSFVNKDVPANVIAAGVPAKTIRKLEDEEIEDSFV